jgi:hypothetical protein
MKTLKISIFTLIAVMLIAACGSFIGCQQDNFVEEEETVDFSTYLSLNRSDINILDWGNWSETDKETFAMAEKRMAISFDEDGRCYTKWTSNSQVNISDELFTFFVNQVVAINNLTEQLVQSNFWAKPYSLFVRLKVGSNEKKTTSNCCVTKCIADMVNAFGSAKYSLADIDSYIKQPFPNIPNYSYYTYDADGDPVVLENHINAVLGHFLYIYPSSNAVLTYNNFKVKYLLGIKNVGSTTGHMVVFKEYRYNLTTKEYEVHYTDPQDNNISRQCSLEDVTHVWVSTGVK